MIGRKEPILCTQYFLLLENVLMLRYTGDEGGGQGGNGH